MAKRNSSADSTTSTTEAPAAYVTETATDSIVDRWFVETFHNRGIDPHETNRLIAAKDRLKVLLNGVRS